MNASWASRSACDVSHLDDLRRVRSPHSMLFMGMFRPSEQQPLCSLDDETTPLPPQNHHRLLLRHECTPPPLRLPIPLRRSPLLLPLLEPRSHNRPGLGRRGISGSKHQPDPFPAVREKRKLIASVVLKLKIRSHDPMKLRRRVGMRHRLPTAHKMTTRTPEKRFPYEQHNHHSSIRKLQQAHRS